MVVRLTRRHHAYRITPDTHSNSLSVVPSDEDRIRLVEISEAIGRNRLAIQCTLSLVIGIEVMHKECVALSDDQDP